MQRQLSENEKHGLAAGAAPPERADWTIDQGWEQLHRRRARRLEDAVRAPDAAAARARLRRVRATACSELPIGADQIPDFRRLSDALMQRTGWQVVAVPGLVPDDVFFDHLANRRFPSGQFIRKPHELDYLEEPDVFHDVFGHVPMLMNPVIADYIQAYGEGGLRAQRLGVLRQPRARLLVHGRVRPGAAARRPAHLRRRHRLVGHREPSSRSTTRRRTGSASTSSG